MGRRLASRHPALAALFCLAVVAGCGGSSTSVVAPAVIPDRCAVTVTATAQSIDASGGTGAVNVQTARECQWTATSDAAWLSIPAGASGQGPSTVPFTAASNNIPSVRRGTIAVNGQRVEITQAAAVCTVSLSTRAVNVGAGGGSASVALTTQDSCTWTVVSRESWITVTSRTNGSGNTDVTVEVAANSGVPRDGIVEIAGQPVTVSQAAAQGCSFTIDPSTAAIGAVGSQTTVTVSATPNCAWSAVSDVPWITTIGASAGNGNGAVVLQISANSDGPRTGQVSIAGRTFTVSQAAAPVACTYAVTPSTRSVGAGGGVTTFGVTAQSGCAWSAIGAPSWMTISNGNGTGNGTVTVTVESNTGAARSATLTIAGRPVVVEQEAAPQPPPPPPPPPPPLCTYTLDPTSHTAPAAGGALSVTVTTAGGCAWSTVGLPSWITATNGSGTGAGTVSLSVQANTGAARNASFTIGGQSFIVDQSAAAAPVCTFSINPTSHNAPAGGGNTSVTVSAASGCAWTTTGLPSWITLAIGSGSGTGNGTVTLAVQANTGGARNATVTIAGQTFTVNQAASGPTCTYSIAPTSHSATAQGGNTSVTVTTASTCSWTTIGLPSWITFTNGTGAGTGNGSVNLTVQANSGASRSATLTIAGQAFTVNQAAPCSFAVSPETFEVGAGERVGDQALAVTVVTGLQCTWTASVTGGTSWLSVLEGAGTGPGVVYIEVERNRGNTRTGTVTVAGRTVTINQGRD